MSSRTQAQISTEEARAKLPLRDLLEQHGEGPKKESGVRSQESGGQSWHGFTCPFCAGTARLELRERRTGLIREDSMAKLKQGLDIVAVVGKDVELKKAGAEFKACCPFHHEKSPSFQVSPRKQLFHCFGCNTGGDVFGWMVKKHGLKFYGAVEHLAKESGFALEYETQAAGEVLRCGTCEVRSERREDGGSKIEEEKRGLDEAGYLALKNKISRKDAWRLWLQQAGVWKQRDSSAGSVRGGALSARKNAFPEEAEVRSQKPEDRTDGHNNNAESGEVEFSKEAKPVLETGAPEDLEGCGSQSRAPRAPQHLPGEDPQESPDELAAALNKTTRPPGFPNEVDPEAEAHMAEAAGEGGLEACPTIDCPPDESLESGDVLPDERGPASSLPAEGAGGGERGEVREVRCEDGGSKMEGKPVLETGAPSEEEERSLAAGRVLQEFYDECGRDVGLRDVDLEGICRKRGLPEDVVRARGFLSNVRSHRDILMALAKDHDFEVLEAAGLWRLTSSGKAVPQNQMHGWGMLGKKRVLDAQGVKLSATAKVYDDGGVWDWMEPVFIPYWGAAAAKIEDGRSKMEGCRELLALRPHKGNPKGAVSRLYVPRQRVADPRSGNEEFQTVVVCEGEFKADAIWWAFVWEAYGRRKISAVAVPGISQIRNEEIQQELVDYLHAVKAKRVVLGYDSEEKGDPTLTGSYKPDPKDRVDTEVYARWGAQWLATRGKRRDGGTHWTGVVAHLPKEWRIDGKADWDGRLAAVRSAEAVELRRAA